MACREQAVNLRNIAYRGTKLKHGQAVKTQGSIYFPKVFSPPSDTRTSTILLSSSLWTLPATMPWSLLSRYCRWSVPKVFQLPGEIWTSQTSSRPLRPFATRGTQDLGGAKVTVRALYMSVGTLIPHCMFDIV